MQEMIRWKARQMIDNPRQAVVTYPIIGENFSAPMKGWQITTLGPSKQKCPGGIVSPYRGT